MRDRPTAKQLAAENSELRERLDQAEQTLGEIFSGGADALMIPGADAARLFTLQGADQAYRLLIEEMSEGALRMTVEGVILYANRRFAEMLKTPLEKVIGSAIHGWVAPDSQDTLRQLLRHDDVQTRRHGEVMLVASDGTRIQGYLSVNLLQVEKWQQSFSMLATDLTEQNQLAAAIAAEKLAQKTLAAANRSRRVLLSVIEDQKRAEEGLRDSEKKFRQLFEGSRDALMTVTPPAWQFGAANKAALQLFGAETLAQFTSRGLWDISPERQPDGRLSAEKAQAMIAATMNAGSNLFEWVCRRIDGTSFPADVLLTRIEAGGQPLIQATVRDITERKRTEDERDRATHLLGERLKELSCLYAVSTAVADSGSPVEQVMQRIVEAIPLAFQSSEATCARLSLRGRQYQSGDFKETAWRLASAIVLDGGKGDGELEVFYTEERPASDTGPFLQEEQALVATIARMAGDYLRFHHALSQLRESEKEFHTLAETMPQIVWITRPDGWNIYFNQHWMDYTGLTAEESMGHGWNEPFHPDDQKTAWDAWQDATRNLTTYSLEVRLRRADGAYRWWLVRGVPVKDEDGKVLKWFGTCTDIHDLKSAEQEIVRSNRALKTLSAGNLALVRANSEDELLQTITSVIVEQAGYVQAVVDYAEDDPGKRITPKAWSGYEGEDYWAENLSWADVEHGQLPVSRAIRMGKTQICRDIAGDPAFKPWREHALQRGYFANIALPMSDGKRTFGGLSIYSSDANAFNDEEVQLLEELANDLAYGIINLRTRKAHEQHSVILRQSLEQSIQTIAATVESRDPYTAGHQRRVSELATAIARKMGLPEDQINGIHLAATIHDLGKIRVPAEVLSKPGKLTDIEFMLIKEHPQNGYNILKDVTFPWPIADVVWQHHERLDGSGYPQGLRGDQILLESRILAVADVVEAMSSHRPYRAALGIEPALGEIKRGSGSAYDPAVVDACLKLFADNEFAFSRQAS